MALEHALLVALSEEPAAGIALARRFEHSVGFFWSATHQQIYRTLGRMESTGWVSSTMSEQSDRPPLKVYSVTPAGSTELRDWLATPTETEPIRSDVALKLGAASYGDRPALLEHLRTTLADHELRWAHFRELLKQDYPNPEALHGAARDQYLVLRGAVRLEEFWIEFLSDFLTSQEDR